MIPNQQNQIEAYLSGEMSAEQLTKFEAEVNVNPQLQQELNFQSEIIQGIGEYRKVELIARLNSLKVPSAWWAFVQQSSTIQYIGGAVITAMVGTGTWFVIQNDNPVSGLSEGAQEVVVDAPNSAPTEWNLPEVIRLEETGSEVSDNDSSDIEEKDVSTESRESFIPKIAVPLAGDIESEKAFVPEQAGEPSEITMGDADTRNPINVEIIESTQKIKYKYYDGKLYLYGNFQQEPYEIIEINSAVGRRIYLYHLEDFYQIIVHDQPVDLQPVTNTKLIQELNILRKSK